MEPLAAALCSLSFKGGFILSLNNKYILFFLCFLLLFNFCLRPYNVEAVVPEVIGGKLLTFLLAMAAAGVTLSVSGKTDSQLAIEANFLLDQFETANGQIQFWQDSLLCYLMNKGYQVVDSFTFLLDDIKDWIVSYDVDEGLVDFGYEIDSRVLDSLYALVNFYNIYDYGTYTCSLYNCVGVGLTTTWVYYYDYDMERKRLQITNTFSNGVVTSGVGIGWDGMPLKIYIESYVGNSVLSTNGNWGSNLGLNYSEVAANTVIPQPVSQNVPVNVDSDSYSLTGVPPNYYHKPNVLPPPVPTTTWDLTTGRSITTWPGTAEDFADGFADTVTWDDYRDVVAGVPSVPYSFNETVPGTLTIDYDYDYEDEGAGAVPVPYPDTYEGDIPSEGLLQGITNWLTSIINVILSIPAKLIALLKELLITLFVPEPDFVQNKAIDINSKIGDKIGDNDYMNFLDSLKSLQGEPIPDGYLYGYKVFDASHINDMAESLKNWQRWFWYILIVLWYMNNVYKMIRGSNMVDFKAYDGVKDGGSSGGVKR